MTLELPRDHSRPTAFLVSSLPREPVCHHPDVHAVSLTGLPDGVAVIHQFQTIPTITVIVSHSTRKCEGRPPIMCTHWQHVHVGRSMEGFPVNTTGRIVAPVLIVRLEDSPSQQLAVMSFDGFMYLIDGLTGCTGAYFSQHSG